MNDREKLAELIGSTEYGNGSLVGNNFQKGFIEKIASHLIDNGVTVQRWIPVAERLPLEEYEEYKERWKDDEDPAFLVMIEGAILPNHQYFDGERWYSEIGSSGRYYHEVTHWMNMPEPPARD